MSRVCAPWRRGLRYKRRPSAEDAGESECARRYIRFRLRRSTPEFGHPRRNPLIIQLPVVVQARARNPKESSFYGVSNFVPGAAIVCGRCCSQTQVIDVDLASTGYR